MKNNIVMVLLFLSIASFGQSATQVKNLTKIGKVWGFLKYYHPAIAKKQIDWDTELSRLLPMSAKTSKDFDIALADWYGTLPKARLSFLPSQPKGDSILAIFDESDLRKFKLNNTFTDSLIQLYAYHIPDSNSYYTNKYKQYTLDFLLNKEAKFDENSFPDRNLRMLALFRYWNIISYQYPHKKQLKQKWDKILAEFIPLFWQARNEVDYQNVVQRLTATLNDSHSSYQEKGFDENQAFNVSFELVKVRHRYDVSGFYNEEIATGEGIRRGDEILRINGLRAKAYEKAKLFGVSGSNVGSKSRDQARQLLRIDTAKTVALVVGREGEKLSLTATRHNWETLRKKSANSVKTAKALNWKHLGNGVWHVKFCAITTTEELKEMFAAIQLAKKVIWDMRGYPVYSLLPQTFASLMPQTTDLGWNAITDPLFPGKFTLKKEVYVPEVPKFSSYDGDMIVLVNEQTQSLAESLSAQLSLRPKTLIMGMQTAGTTGNVNYIDLPGGIQTSFTAVGVYGKEASFEQGKGVKIDARVRRSRAEIKSKTDFLLQKAIQQKLNVR